MVLSQFANQGELDAFFARVPADAHRAWGERFAPHVVDGSPAWHVYRPVPVLRAPAAAAAANGADAIDLSEYAPGSRVVMDWKGDPMVISPGDKLPNVA